MMMSRVAKLVAGFVGAMSAGVLIAETSSPPPTEAVVSWPQLFGDPIFQWIVGTVVAVSALLVAFFALRKKPDTPTINVNNVIDADALANQLASRLNAGNDPAQKDQEIAALKQTIERLQADETETAKQQALQLLQQGDTEQALELLEQAARTRSEQAGELSQKAAQDWLDIGNIAYLNDTQKALHAYQNASELDTGNPDVWNRLGHVHRRQGKLDEAANYYRKVLELSGKNETWQAVAYGNLGNIYQIRGELDKAEEYHRKALEINRELDRREGMAKQYGNLGLNHLTRGELNKACESWRESLRLLVSVGAKDRIESVERLLAENCGAE